MKKNKQFDAVALKRELQQKAEEKLLHLTFQHQMKLLQDRYGRLMKGAKARGSGPPQPR